MFLSTPKYFSATCLLMLSLAFAVVTDAADLPEPTESTIKSVTVYRNQARVVREFKVPANAAIQRFHIAGLPKQFIQGSAFTESDEDTRVRSLQVIPKIEEIDDVKLQTELEELQEKRDAAKESLKVIEQDMLTLEKLVSFSSSKVQQNIDRATLDVESITNLAEFTMKKRRVLADELFAQQAEIEKFEKEIAAKQKDLSKQSATTSAYGAMVAVVSQAGGWVRLTYDVSEASWTPKYKIHASNLQADEPKFKIQLAAQIFQKSGEYWSDVALTLSTATPNGNVARPLLTPLRVDAVASEQNISKSIVGQFEGTDGHAQSWMNDDLVALNVRLNSQAGIRQINELTSSAEVQREVAADASALASEESYELENAVSLPNIETAQTVAILDYEASGEYYRVVTPLLSSFAFREALLLNDTGQTLIAGPADVYQENVFVGRIFMPPTAAGQKVTVGFGTDRQVRSRRELLQRDDAIRGGNRQSSLKYRLVVSNFHEKPVKIRLLDRIPIAAKDDSITVTLPSSETERLSKDPLYMRMQRPTGILRWDLDIPEKRFGSEAFDHEYEYSVELDRQQTIVGGDLARRMKQDTQFKQMNGGGMGGGGGFGGGGTF